MNEHCRGCIRYLKSCSGMAKAVCEKHKLHIPRTNADRIRAIGDIELGNFLSGLILGCSDCPMYEECDGANCNSRWQKWLKEEAT